MPELTCELTNMSFRLLPDLRVLVVDFSGPLTASDFAKINHFLDPWLESHGHLQGIVAHAAKFSGWKNAEALGTHLRFVREHHRHVERVALAVDGLAPRILRVLTEFFVHAEIKCFGYAQIAEAIRWASSGPEEFQAHRIREAGEYGRPYIPNIPGV